jgi:hypothetical protein
MGDHKKVLCTVLVTNATRLQQFIPCNTSNNRAMRHCVDSWLLIDYFDVTGMRIGISQNYCIQIVS